MATTWATGVTDLGTAKDTGVIDKALIDAFKNDLPEIAYDRLSRIRDEGLLLSYQNIDGIRSALERIGNRFKRPVDLTRGVDLLVGHDEAFAADFEIFYPELMRETGRSGR